MRDLRTDMEICNAATPEPWELTVKGNSVKSYAINGICHGMKIHGKDAYFIAEARQGWPEAIRRAMDAEARANALEDALRWIIANSDTGMLYMGARVGAGIGEQIRRKALAALDDNPGV